MDIQNTLVLTKRKEDEERKDREFGISRCKLYFIYKTDKQQVLLYSTRSCVHYPVINHNGKEYFKMHVYIYIYITELLCCIAIIVNQHCKSTILQFKKDKHTST